MMKVWLVESEDVNQMQAVPAHMVLRRVSNTCEGRLKGLQMYNLYFVVSDI